MSLSAGLFAFPAFVTKDGEIGLDTAKARKHSSDNLRGGSKSFDSLFGRERVPERPRPHKRDPPSYSAKSWVNRSRHRKVSNAEQEAKVCQPSQRKNSSSAGSERSSPHDSFDFSPSRARALGRPKHIPIIIPDKYSYVPPSLGSASSLSSFPSPKDTHRSKPLSQASTLAPSASNARTTPRHVEISLPDWAQAALTEDRGLCLKPLPELPPTHCLSESGKLESNMSQRTPESSRTNTMDSSTSRLSPERLGAGRTNYASQTDLVSHFGSQASFDNLQMDEGTSASEAEDNRPLSPRNPHSSGTLGSAPSSGSGGMNVLHGLICNVHRTTGKEPQPLVGATTTILGDKLYVFGGRRLSRTKPDLMSNLYELDLIRRHWTKIDALGDVPKPRYFHSVCPLGDNKLVCYGGMSPGPAPEGNSEVPPQEMVVMSDIHVFDVPTLTWTKLTTPDAPQGRYAHCAAILPSSAVFASRNASMSAIHHNPADANPNSGTLGVTLDGAGGAEMVVVGGQDNANHYIEQVSIFNFRSLKWTGTTGMGRACGAYRSVVTPLSTMTASQIGSRAPSQLAGKQGNNSPEEEETSQIGSGAPMLIYSNYNFMDVKLELQIRLVDGTLTEKAMSPDPSPPGLRFPSGGIIANHFVVAGTFLTANKQEYAVWSLDLVTLTWSKIDAGGSILGQGSWNRGVVWNRRNSLVILGNRKRSLIEDYNNRRINFTNMCVVELEAFGIYENPKTAGPRSGFVSASSASPHASTDGDFERLLSSAAEDLGNLALNVRELADMEFLSIDGTRIPVNSRLISRRWGPHFITLLRDSLISAADADTATLRPSLAENPSRNSSITITPSITASIATTLVNQSTDLPDTKSVPPATRPRLFYLPHTALTLHALLHYLYTSTLPATPHRLATPQIFCALLQFARPYQIDGLQEAVLERLHECLGERNAAAVFNAAAMAAGGGESIRFASSKRSVNDSGSSIRTASLAGIDGLLTNGGSRTIPGLRIDTDMANGRSTRNTTHSTENPQDGQSEDDPPSSAHTDSSMSESELSAGSGDGVDRRRREVWNGGISSTIGIQKRALRSLMDGRKKRERARMDGQPRNPGVDGSRVGLGIA